MLDLIRDQQGRLNSALVVKWLFIGLLLALCLGRAFGAEVDLELMIFVAGVAGFEDVTYLLRRGQDRRVERARAESTLPRAHALWDREGRLLTPAVTEVRGDDEAAAEDPSPLNPLDIDPDSLSVVLYEAYNAGGDPATAGLNFRGEKCPRYAALPPNVVQKWGAAAQLVVDLMRGKREAVSRYMLLLAKAAGGCPWAEGSNPPAPVPPPSCIDLQDAPSPSPSGAEGEPARRGPLDGLHIFIDGRIATAAERARIEARCKDAP